jgi:hypothetical protein
LHKPDSWISQYTGKDATARSTYLLKSESDGSTTLMYRSTIEPKGFLTSLFSPLVKPFVKRVFSSEMEIFIKTLERDFSLKKTN